MTKAKVLYVAGYSRSGSTLLDIVLSGHPEITGVGEITFLLEDWPVPTRKCSCGVRYRDCAFWSDFLPDAVREIARCVRKIEQRASILRLLLGAIRRRDRQLYRQYHEKLFAHIRSKTGGSIVLDSSKSARKALGRMFALSWIAKQDVYVLHLVRNGYAVMESEVVTGNNWALEGRALSFRLPVLRAALGWVITNGCVPVLGRLVGRGRYKLLRYEDFVADPAGALNALGTFCGFDAGVLVDRISRDESFAVGHMVGGNRVRLQGQIKVQRASGKAVGTRLKAHQRALFACLGGWLQYLYGYRRAM